VKDCGICILAGGQSKRMGRSKTALRLGSKTLLGHIRTEARTLGLGVRIIRRDSVPRCGPLGGIYTGLKTSRAAADLFLACDMPFVSAGLMKRLLAAWRSSGRAAFLKGEFRVSGSGFRVGGAAGFPLLLPVQALTLVEGQLQKREFSIQKLMKAVGARGLRVSRGREWELFNVNTPEEFEMAKRLMRTEAASRQRTAPGPRVRASWKKMCKCRL